MEHYPLVIGDKLVTHGSMDLINPATGKVWMRFDKTEVGGHKKRKYINDKRTYILVL